MKPREVMINDWVQARLWDWSTRSFYLKAVKIKAVYEYAITDEHGNTLYEDRELFPGESDVLQTFRPIPLSEDILFKNEIKEKRTFTQNDWYGYVQYYYKKRPVISLSLEPNSTLGYVHIFQHKLLEMGFTELADNFKLE